MSKQVKNPQFECIECGTEYVKWSGKCLVCGNWNSIKDISETKLTTRTSSATVLTPGINAQNLHKNLPVIHQLNGTIEEEARILTGISELDRVLGSGLVVGSAVLIGGEPGIGKSTILMQLTSNIATKNKNLKAVYISGEESVSQIRMRAKRLGVETSDAGLVTTTSLLECLAIIQSLKNGDIAVIDSIQTIYSDDAVSGAGSVTQIKFCASQITALAKALGVAVIFVGHVTKDGQIAGPKLLEHMVDTVVYFEADETKQYRIIRTTKNRFGAVDEIGVFEMTSFGLKEILNPSQVFLQNRMQQAVGSVVNVCIEGTRPLLVNVECLIAPSFTPSPRRSAVGIDLNRLAMIIAVLSSKLRLKLFDKEVYINVSGGIKIGDPSVDLAVAIAIISTLSEIKISQSVACFGEIGLSGSIRGGNMPESRIKETIKLGFTTIITPKLPTQTLKNLPKDNLNIIQIENIKDLLKILENLNT